MLHASITKMLLCYGSKCFEKTRNFNTRNKIHLVAPLLSSIDGRHPLKSMLVNGGHHPICWMENEKHIKTPTIN
jgi:hypothetical protein